jgi:hypothetical protein
MALVRNLLPPRRPEQYPADHLPDSNAVLDPIDTQDLPAFPKEMPADADIEDEAEGPR